MCWGGSACVQATVAMVIGEACVRECSGAPVCGGKR
jgi:hypothetical protein